ncbi:MAG: hypothetical protein ACODAU_02930 [Myxococcota bacterium]
MRTDRTTLCAHCAVRFPAAGRCPRCGGSDLFDLTRAKARRLALRAVDRPSRPPPATPWWSRAPSLYLRYGVALLTAAGALAGGWFGETWIAVFVLGLAAFWVALALFFVGSGLLYLGAAAVRLLFALARIAARRMALRGRNPARRILTIDDQEVLRSPHVRELRGRVRAGSPLRSPLEGLPCVAWRVAGEGPVGDVDDALAAPFELVTDDGRTIRVLPSPATVAVELDARPRPVKPSPELARFLQERGVYPERGPVTLAEAVLKDGDRVVVEGAFETAPAPSGSSDGAAGVMREHPGAPLVVRRVPL